MIIPVRIAPGDRGEPVRDLKHRLAALGFPRPDEEAVDEFGASTEANVRAFQAQRRLRVDGICGPQTWGALVESGFSLGDRLVYLRSPMLRGDDVAELQRRLNALGFDAGKEDGIFGPDTESALREFQRNAGITVDAICGPETVASLDRLGSGDRAGSVALARERESLLSARPGLAGRKVFVAVEPGLETLADVVRGGLVEGRAAVVLEVAGDDQSALAAEANRFEADLVVVLRLGDAPVPTCAFYESGAFRSERGHRAAACVLEAVAEVVGGPPAEPLGRTDAVLRETRAPAIVCEPVAAGDPDGMDLLVTKASDIGQAIAAGLRRAADDPAGPAQA